MWKWMNVLVKWITLQLLRYSFIFLMISTRTWLITSWSNVFLPWLIHEKHAMILPGKTKLQWSQSWLSSYMYNCINSHDHYIPEHDLLLQVSFYVDSWNNKMILKKQYAYSNKKNWLVKTKLIWTMHWWCWRRIYRNL